MRCNKVLYFDIITIRGYMCVWISWAHIYEYLILLCKIGCDTARVLPHRQSRTAEQRDHQHVLLEASASQPTPQLNYASREVHIYLATLKRRFSGGNVDKGFGAAHQKFKRRGFNPSLLQVGNQPHAKEASLRTRT